MTDKTSLINGVIRVMRDWWDLPADCNDGELFTYAERLVDRIEAGDSKDKLCAYLAGVETGNLEMPPTSSHREIVDRAVALAKGSG